jgi:hypothetical protein
VTHSIRRSMSTPQATGNACLQATALTRLGNTHYATGDLTAARNAGQQALTISIDLTTPTPIPSAPHRPPSASTLTRAPTIYRLSLRY